MRQVSQEQRTIEVNAKGSYIKRHNDGIMPWHVKLRFKQRMRGHRDAELKHAITNLNPLHFVDLLLQASSSLRA